VCDGGCGRAGYCGTDCKCHARTEVIPELTIGEEQMKKSIAFETRLFNEWSCANSEQCIGGLGYRRLLRFDTYVINQGFTNLLLPRPDMTPNEFFFAQCHNHYHYNGFSEYRLLNQQGAVVARGHKQAFCLEDITPLREPNTPNQQVGKDVPCDALTTCEQPGIQRGWADIYDSSLDCQWVDVTGITPGDYFLRVELNVKRAIFEGNYENNILTIPVNIPLEDNYAGR